MSDIKNIILCADDFGLNAGVSQGILNLAQQRRLSAVSCMVNQPAFAPYAEKLLALKKQIHVGLHFNLTEGYFVSAPHKPCFSLNELLIKTHLGLPKLAFIAQEFKAQLELFVQVMGCLPDFIDGHQHVHQFPRVRGVVLELYAQYLQSSGARIRATWPTLNNTPYSLKAKILALTGGKTLQAQLKKLAIPHNHYFSGIYDFAANTDYRALFQSWLSNAGPHTLIMCHPGEPDEEIDAIAATRVVELNYFLSDHFLADCVHYSVQL